MDICTITISAHLTGRPHAVAETCRETLSTSYAENIDPAGAADLAPLIDIIERESRRGGLRQIRHNRITTAPDISISAWPDREDPLVILTVLRPGRHLTDEYFNPSVGRIRHAIRIIVAAAEQVAVAV